MFNPIVRKYYYNVSFPLPPYVYFVHFFFRTFVALIATVLYCISTNVLFDYFKSFIMFLLFKTDNFEDLCPYS